MSARALGLLVPAGARKALEAGAARSTALARRRSTARIRERPVAAPLVAHRCADYEQATKDIHGHTFHDSSTEV